MYFPNGKNTMRSHILEVDHENAVLLLEWLQTMIKNCKKILKQLLFNFGDSLITNFGYILDYFTWFSEVFLFKLMSIGRTALKVVWLSIFMNVFSYIFHPGFCAVLSSVTVPCFIIIKEYFGLRKLIHVILDLLLRGRGLLTYIIYKKIDGFLAL